MYFYLKYHPDIFLAAVKEPNYFNIDHHSVKFIRDKETYLSLFATAGHQRQIGEATTWYLYSTEAASQIRAFCPSAKILIMLRNPVDFVGALHSHNVYHCLENLVDLETALNAERDRKAGYGSPTRAHFPMGLLYLEIAHFADQVERYIQAFGPNQVHFIIFDDLIRDVGASYEETLRFLEIDPVFRPRFDVFNASRQARSPVIQGFLEHPPDFVQRAGEFLIPKRARYPLRRGLNRLNARHRPRNPMGSDLRKRLQESLLSDVRRLSGLLGRDLTYWCDS
jgi:hypothetical protein